MSVKKIAGLPRFLKFAAGEFAVSAVGPTGRCVGELSLPSPDYAGACARLTEIREDDRLTRTATPKHYSAILKLSDEFTKRGKVYFAHRAGRRGMLDVSSSIRIHQYDRVRSFCALRRRANRAPISFTLIRNFQANVWPEKWSIGPRFTDVPALDFFCF